ncbi:MAG: hypothetical protein U9R66_03610 [Thermodesulfobacteriota bacterium]|nr:hypothetical protein [Thermodesulfobacteriota bacterium]
MKMKQISFIVVIAAAIFTVVIGVKTTSYPISAGALGFIGWAVSPYFYLAGMAKFVAQRAAVIVVAVLAFLVGGFGVWAFIDAMFIHPDAQGGLVFVVVPMWEWALLLLATLPVYLLNKVKNEA